MTSAEAVATSAWVRIPAPRSRRSRSRPIREPNTAATTRRTITSRYIGLLDSSSISMQYTASRRRAHETKTHLQPQARLGGQPEECLASRMGVPCARAPPRAAHIVAAVEHLGKRHTTELRHREERRRLHLDREASFGQPLLYFGGRLAIDGVGRPRFGGQIADLVCLQNCFERGDTLRAGCRLCAPVADSDMTCPRRGSPPPAPADVRPQSRYRARHSHRRR